MSNIFSKRVVRGGVSAYIKYDIIQQLGTVKIPSKGVTLAVVGSKKQVGNNIPYSHSLFLWAPDNDPPDKREYLGVTARYYKRALAKALMLAFAFSNAEELILVSIPKYLIEMEAQ